MPGPLKPLIAIPTTAGTGSETTGVSIFDLTRMHAKTGIASRRLKPTLGYLDPDNTRTMPPQVAASTGLDILSHAVESYTAMPYHRPAAAGASGAAAGLPGLESDQRHLVAAGAAHGGASILVRAVDDPSDDEARAQMLLAASYAGVGFGNAGVHLPHGMSYPVSGNVQELSRARLRDRSPARAARHVGDPERAGRVPLHGVAPTRRAICEAAEALGADVSRAQAADDAGRFSPIASPGSCSGCGCRTACSAIGYSSSDIPALVEGTLPQHRVTKLSPRPAGPDELARLFEDAMVAWSGRTRPPGPVHQRGASLACRLWRLSRPTLPDAEPGIDATIGGTASGNWREHT